MTKQSDIEMVAKARAWAVKAHAGQKDKAGQDYFKAHVTVVAEGLTPPTISIVGFLGGAARFIAKPCLKQRVVRFPIIRYRRSA